MLRTNELEIGTWVLKTTRRRRRRAGRRTPRCWRNKDHWFVRETIGLLRRTLARLDVSSRTPVRADRSRAPASPARWPNWPSAADRSYMLALPDDADKAPKLALSRNELRLLPDGQRPDAPAAPLLRRSRADGSGPRRASARRWTPTPRWPWAWSPPRRTTSTGTTRCASRWRSAPPVARRADRHGGQPALQPARRTWRRASSAA